MDFSITMQNSPPEKDGFMARGKTLGAPVFWKTHILSSLYAQWRYSLMNELTAISKGRFFYLLVQPSKSV